MHERLNKSDESQKTSHLNTGVKPIVACIGTKKDTELMKDIEVFKKGLGNPNEIVNSIHDVNYTGFPYKHRERGFLNAGVNTYVISNIDSHNKFSEDFFICTCLIVVGKDKITGENISFLTHQNPKKILSTKRSEFLADLRKQLNEIKDRCAAGTIDAVVLGGKYRPSTSESSAETAIAEDYQNSIKLLEEEVRQILGFDPIIVNEPKKNDGESEDIYYENRNRRLYFIRKVNPV